MLRETNVQRLHWADKTMSVIRQEQLEACDKRLLALPNVTVFDLTDELRTEEIWQCSYDAQEHPKLEKLHTRKELRAQVLGSLAAEAALLWSREGIQEAMNRYNIKPKKEKKPKEAKAEEKPAEAAAEQPAAAVEATAE